MTYMYRDTKKDVYLAIIGGIQERMECGENKVTNSIQKNFSHHLRCLVGFYNLHSVLSDDFLTRFILG